MPARDDVRYERLISSRVEAIQLNKVRLDEVCNRVSLARVVGCSVILRGNVEEQLITLSFGGGTMAQFLAVLGEAGHYSIKFEKLGVSVQPVPVK